LPDIKLKYPNLGGFKYFKKAQKLVGGSVWTLEIKWRVGLSLRPEIDGIKDKLIRYDF